MEMELVGAAGLCACGCGQATSIAQWDDPKRGYVAGQPKRFARGHTSNVKRYSDGFDPNPSGVCGCGCGERVELRAGKHSRFLAGHRVRSGRDYVVDENGCWIWQRSVTHHGYGRVRLAEKYWAAHRFYYERHVGAIPDGWDIHHRCSVRRCVNPEHLEALSRSDHRRLHPLRDKVAERSMVLVRNELVREIAEVKGSISVGQWVDRVIRAALEEKRDAA